MYIRETITVSKKTGQKYIKHSLVESFRTESGPRQRTVMQLGQLTLPKDKWPELSAELEKKIAGQNVIPGFEGDPEICRIAEKSLKHFRFLEKQAKEKKVIDGNRDITEVDLKSIGTSWNRSFGPELVAHNIFVQLGFEPILKDCNFDDSEISLIEAIIAGRLIKPGGDYSTRNWILNNSAIGELTKTPLNDLKKDAVYNIADKLLDHKEVIEKALLKKEQELFPGRETLYLLDLTNFYFEGQADKNNLAAFGKSKEKRGDCKLVSLALVVDADGFPIASKIYEGNVGEPKTLMEILAQMGFFASVNQQQELFRPTLVMDRGIATIDNLTYLKDHDFPFIIIERSPRHQDYAEVFKNYKDTFTKIDRGVNKSIWVHKILEDNAKIAKVLCISEGREKKERAIKTRWETRAEEDLEKLRKNIASGRLKAADKVGKKYGRLQERYKGLDNRFEIILDIDKQNNQVSKLSWKKIDQEKTENDPLYGCYLIETSHIDKTDIDIWHLYMTLTRVEAAFRCLKTDLGTRPIYHQKAERTEGHLFISILAYHLLIIIEHQLKKNGDNRRWTTVKQLLSTHQQTTVILTDKNKDVYHIRQSSQPEEHHFEIYRKLGIKNPTSRNIKKIIRRT